jgi:hypothetical protein
MSRSNKECRLTHSGKTVETGHGGMKRNKVGRGKYKKMDPMTRASQDIMGDQPASFYGRTTGRWHATRNLSNPRNPQPEVQADAQEQINQRTRSSIQGREGRGGGGSSVGSGGGYTSTFSFGGGFGVGGGRKRGVVTVTDIK